MKKYIVLNRALAALIAGSALAVAIPVLAQSTPGETRPPYYERMRKSQTPPSPPLNRFDKMAQQLQITPAQQSVWNQYRAAIETQMRAKPTLPPAGASDAVTMLRWRADRAADQARKLTAIADATDVLQRSLDGEQRKRLNELVQEEHSGGSEPRAEVPAERAENRPGASTGGKTDARPPASREQPR